jgi:protein-S-isoprenylcysteine O-methyltransferase Ste14
MAGIAEIATILAWNFRSSDLSQSILSLLLMKGGRPEGLQLTPIIALGGMMIITGSLIRLATYRYLGQFFRFEASIQRNHKLVTGGPYSIVRHPGYTGLLISHSGWFLWQFWEGSWVRESGLLDTMQGKFAVLSYTLLVILGGLYLVLMRMSKEDEALRKHFGKQWEDWAKNVPYYVVPGIY